MNRNLILLICSVALLQSCLITKQVNLGFVKKRHIDKKADVMSFGATTFFVKPFLNMALEEEDKDIKTIAKSIKGLRFTSIENQADFSKIDQRLTNYLDRKNYEEWVSIQTEGEHIRVNALKKKDKITRVLVGISSQDGDGLYLRLKGKIDLDQMTQAIQNLTENDFKLKKKKGTEVALQE